MIKSFKFLNLKISIFLLFLFSTFSACVHRAHWPKDGEISCNAKPSKANSEHNLQKHMLFKWGENLSSNLRNTLTRFKKGEIGNKATNLKLHGLSAEEIHKLLMSNGFRHQSIPLVVHPVHHPNLYWLKNGSKQDGKPTTDNMALRPKGWCKIGAMQKVT